LPEQSIKILALLVEKPGEVVLRDDIREKLWPNDTVVEFDHSINAAIKRLRQALGDSVDKPVYIETLARRGYRWVAPVEREAPEPVAATPVNPQQSALDTQKLIGSKVSHYRVLELLGGGGMGVVYKAEDLKLGRRVALKFLPEELVSDPAALKRFESEARAASTLNHPSICTIYEVEEYAGQPFIVMELLKGETLRDLIAAVPKKPVLELSKLIDLAIQITEGLKAAHAQGIIHRDIKPANIFLTSPGQAKILDFGLAKLFVQELAHSDFSVNKPEDISDRAIHCADSLPASSPFLSRTGVAMGTAGYMSPEQVRGEKLDARTDLFSFGLVLYEMATGRRAFAGDTAAELHDSILNQPLVPARRLVPAIPIKLEGIMDRALEKDREARYQTATELHADLEKLKWECASHAKFSRRQQIAAMAVTTLIVVSVGLWVVKRTETNLPSVPDLKLRQLTSNSADKRVTSGAISPDGRYLAYTDTKAMYIKLIETGETRNVPNPEALKSENVGWEIGPWYPSGTRFLANVHPAGQSTDDWSSQGASIWTVSVLGGAPRKLHDNAIAYSVSPDGSLVSFGTNKGKSGEREIWLMGSDGQQARKLYEAGEDGAAFGLTWSRMGQRIIYIRSDKSGDALVSRDLPQGVLTTLFPNPDFPSFEMKEVHDFAWLSDGRLIYSKDEPGVTNSTCDFWIIRVDIRTGQIIEKARRLTNWSGFCMARMSITTDNKHMAFVQSESHGESHIADLVPGGMQIVRPRRFPQSESSDGIVDWMPDSKTILFMSKQGIYKQSLEADAAEAIVTESAGRGARVTPDGKWIFYFGKTEAQPGTAPEPLMRVSINGGTPQLLFTAKHHSIIACAKSTSNLCAISEPTDDDRQVIVSTLDPMNGRGPELVRFDVKEKADNWWFDLSPDGTRVAATPSLAGPIYILSLRNHSRQQVQVKHWINLLSLSWAGDGRSLFVLSGNPQGAVLLHVDLQGNANYLWESPGAYGEATAVASPDGRHIAMFDWTQASNMWMIENF
jgi:eukaryotic-like serine/threonine-protein kinase